MPKETTSDWLTTARSYRRIKVWTRFFRVKWHAQKIDDINPALRKMLDMIMHS